MIKPPTLLDNVHFFIAVEGLIFCSGWYIVLPNPELTLPWVCLMAVVLIAFIVLSVKNYSEMCDYNAAGGK